MSQTLVVADDHPLIRVGMVAELSRIGIDDVLQAWDQASLERVVRSAESISLVLLDVVMPGRDGEGWTVQFCEQHPQLPVLLMSGLPVSGLRARFASCTNVRGLISKSGRVRELRGLIDRALAGRLCWDDEGTPEAESGSHPHRGWLEELTPRQRAVADLVCMGLTNRMIAEELAMQEGTVKNHLKEVFLRLGVTNRTQLALRMSSRS